MGNKEIGTHFKIHQFISMKVPVPEYNQGYTSDFYIRTHFSNDRFYIHVHIADIIDMI